MIYISISKQETCLLHMHLPLDLHGPWLHIQVYRHLRHLYTYIYMCVCVCLFASIYVSVASLKKSDSETLILQSHPWQPANDSTVRSSIILVTRHPSLKYRGQFSWSKTFWQSTPTYWHFFPVFPQKRTIT